jgi:predicted amidohydrolase YtcJ
MSFENWNTRNTLRRGIAYAKRWESFEKGEGPEPERNLEFDIFRALWKHEATISTHTQVYQVVLMTLTMVARDLKLPVFLDHSEIGGWPTAKLAESLGVSAIVGPRSVDPVSRGFINWARNKHEGMQGLAAGWQELGATRIGFNTDSPVVPEEELQLQAGMGVRYGFDDSKLAAVRGLTVVPAMTVFIEDRVGSLTPGTDADILVISGHPADPRSHVEQVFIEGKKVYDTSLEHRRW